MKKIILSLIVFCFFVAGKTQNITKIHVAGTAESTSTLSPVIQPASSFYKMVTNPASPISKDVEIHYSGLASGDSVVIWADVTGVQGKNSSISSSWFTIPRKPTSPTSWSNGQGTYGFTVSNAADSLVFQFRFTSIPTSAVNIYVGIKRNGSTTLLNNRPSINFSNTNQFIAVRRSYKWTGAVDSVWQTAGNWEPTRTSVHDSDYLIFDNTNSQLVNIPYNGGKFTQTISKLLINRYSDVRFSNYTKSNGSLAKSTINVSGLYQYGWFMDFARMGFSGTDTLEIEVQNGGGIYVYNSVLYTNNKFGTGGCLVLSSYNTSAWGSFLLNCNIVPVTGVNIQLGDGREQTIAFGNSSLGGTGEVVVKNNATFAPNAEFGGNNVTLNGRLSIYGFLDNTDMFGTFSSNSPASSSEADWHAWTPYLQLRNNGMGRGMIKTYRTISGGVLWEMYNSGNRAWRTVGFPMKNSVNISQITDDIVISGTNSGDNRDSFFSFNTSCSYCAPSIKYWDESTSAWADYTSGNTANKIPVGQGILLFFRGMGTQGLGNNLASATAGSMDFKGQIHSGSKTVNLSYSGSGSLKGYNLIANPFPANVDFNLITRTNVANKYLVYEPKQRMYNVYDKSSGSVVLTGSTAFEASTTAQSSIIEMGASVFMIATASSPSVTFDEADRVYTQPNVSAFRMTNNVPCNQLKIKLTYENESASPLMDKCLLEWNQSANGAKEGVDAMDMNKLYAGYLGVGTISADKEWLGIDRREDVVANAITVPLKIKTLDTFGYKFTFNTCDQQDLYSVELLDAVTETKTKVSNESTYLFKRKSNDLQVEDNRFSLVITPTEQAGIKEKSTRFTEVVRLQPVPVKAGEDMQISVGEGNDILGVALLDMQGRLLKEVAVGQKNLVDFTLPSEITAGNYLLKVKHRNGEESKLLPIIK
jgi:hypothetical protein